MGASNFNVPPESIEGIKGSLTNFEGFEKRLEISFKQLPTSSSSQPQCRGLRELSRGQVDELLQAAKCSIVAELSNDLFDSYVLSESSLFIYPLKVVLKTCGTTQLLKAIPILLRYADTFSMQVRFCKYSRGSFMFPAAQNFPHRCFHEEARYLEHFFGHLGLGGKMYVLGDQTIFPNWHIYEACDAEMGCRSSTELTYTLEMCMLELNKQVSRVFLNPTASKSGEDMTKESGVGNILPGTHISDFSFEPCGYSMNAIEKGAHSTIHVAPEDGVSFASFETMGYGPKEVDLRAMVDAVTSVFKPKTFSLCLHVAGDLDHLDLEGMISHRSGSWNKSICPSGFVCSDTSRQEFACGSVAVFSTYKAVSEYVSVGPGVKPLTPFEPSRSNTLRRRHGKGIHKVVECEGDEHWIQPPATP